MSLVKPLCVLPDPPVDGCCNPQEPMPAAPVRPNNPPGLTAITYRIGDFTSFRRAMLDDVARPDLLHGLFDDRPLLSNPFANWHEGGDGDYHTMLIELWAYLADVLTFYQERIANEAYLPTATQRSSALRLVELIGYRPSPGAAASVLLAFTAAKDKMPVAFPRFRVGSRATPDRPAAVYETSAALQTRGEHSAISFSSVAPTNQFAALTDLQVVAGKVQANQTALAQAVTRVWGEAGVRYLRGIPFAAYRMARPAPPASTKKVLRSVVLAGANNRLAAGDYVLLVEYEGKATEQKTPLRLTHVDVDRTAHTTTIQWSEDPGQHYENVTLYALRVTAAPFGSNAPAWNTLPATLIGTVNGVEGPYAKTNWDDTKGPSAFLPTLGQPTDFLFLDSLYDDVHATPETPGWVVLVSDTQSDVFQFTEARPVGITGYAISGRVTRLALTQAIPASTFPLRNTTILAGAEELTLQNLLPLPDPLTGQTLLLDGLYPNLQAGQKVIVSGKLYDPNTVSPSQVPSAEEALLDEPPDLDAANNLTTIVLKQPLQGAYVRAETVLMANVVEATQGETVRNEVLGSGNGGPFQVYTLKKSPLTYLPATSAEGLAATESTLQVTVNQVRWEERPTLVESEPNARVFMTRQTDDGKTLVTFGDGVNGARPPHRTG